MSEVLRVDVRGETCPVPLVEARKALLRLPAGGAVEIVGDHDSSWKELPLLAANLGALVETKDGGPEGWRFVLRRGAA